MNPTPTQVSARSSAAHQALFASTSAYLGVALGALNFIVLFPRLLTVEQVGLIRLITAAALIYTKFAFFGLDTTAVRFLSGLKPREPAYRSQWRLLFWLSMLGMLVVSIVALPIIAKYLPGSEVTGISMGTLIAISLALFVAMLWQRFAESIAQVAGLTAAAAFWRDLLPRAAMLIGVGGIFLSLWNFHILLILWMNSYVIGAVWLNLSAYRKNLQSSPIGSLPDRPRIKETLRFASFSFVGTAAAVVQTTLDSIMITALAGLAQLGIYTPFAYAATLIDIPNRALAASAYPRFQTFFKNGQKQEAARLYQDVGLVQLILGGALLLLFWINLPLLLQIMGSQSYQQEGSILLILGSGLWLSASLSQPAQILLCTEHYKLDGILNFCALPVGLILNFILIPMHGAIGAAIATALTLFLLNASKAYIVWKEQRLFPASSYHKKALGLLIVILIINLIIPRPEWPVLIECTLRSILSIVLLFTAAWRLDIIEQLEQVYRRLRTDHG